MRPPIFSTSAIATRSDDFWARDTFPPGPAGARGSREYSAHAPRVDAAHATHHRLSFGGDHDAPCTGSECPPVCQQRVSSFDSSPKHIFWNYQVGILEEPAPRAHFYLWVSIPKVVLNLFTGFTSISIDTFYSSGCQT